MMPFPFTPVLVEFRRHVSRGLLSSYIVSLDFIVNFYPQNPVSRHGSNSFGVVDLLFPFLSSEW